MIAKVGAAARHSRSAAPTAVALPLPAQAPAVSRWRQSSCRILVRDMPIGLGDRFGAEKVAVFQGGL